MAEFCWPCTKSLGPDLTIEDNDFYGIGNEEIVGDDGENPSYEVLCEGCGWTHVDREGRCIEHEDHKRFDANLY